MLFLSMICINTNAQVGINTELPQATLDVAGTPTDNSKLDGIIAPRIAGNQLALKTYTTSQTGAIVFVNTAATNLTGQVINVTTPGYYYFNGSVWSSFSNSLPYKSFIGTAKWSDVTSSWTITSVVFDELTTAGYTFSLSNQRQAPILYFGTDISSVGIDKIRIYAPNLTAVNTSILNNNSVQLYNNNYDATLFLEIRIYN